MSKRDTDRGHEDRNTDWPVGPSGSYIATGMVCHGMLKAAHDLHIDGRLEGDATCKTVRVGASGAVAGSISGDTVHVAGTVHGDIDAQTLRIQASARVDGDLTVRGNLSIEDGAQVDGTIKMGRQSAADAETAHSATPAPSNGSGSRAGSASQQRAAKGAG